MDERIAKQFTISKASPVPLYFQLKTQLVELLKRRGFSGRGQAADRSEFCGCWIFRVQLCGRPFSN